jgi:signal transduction histidine kinase/energy-coupling factor transporter ATP-binding protein EcfA2
MNNKAHVKTILLLAANPRDTSKLQLDVEVREIDEGLRRANKREQFKLEQKWAVRSRDFYRAILDTQPQIVHFSGHGTAEDGIILENEMKQSVYVQADALASMFKLFAKKGVECVVLNACYSEVQAEAISQYVKYVIGMNKAVGDKAAVAFAVAFYDALGAGEDVEFAYELGKSQMMGFMEHQTPVLKKNELTDVSTTFETDVIPPNPYQGLSAFGEEDAAFFFGRETFVNELVQTTRKQPLVGVVGPSGSGKSSIVFAGLIPQLRSEGNWLISSFRPGNQPFYQLACALVRLLEPELSETGLLREAAGLAGDMQSGRISLQQVAYSIKERNGGKRLLLVADQFEELYTLCQKEEQESFADALLAAISPEMTLVFTLRADFYGYVLSYRPFRDALQEFTPQLLSSMKREELEAAIALPAQKLDVQLEAQLTQRILDDVGQEPGNLPLLEFALTRLWVKQENRVLTHHAYDEIGGVKKAIANHAEQVYQQLNQSKQKQAERIFVQLVRPGEGTEDTRRMATRAEVGEDNWGLVSYLAGYQARLVVTGRREDLTPSSGTPLSLARGGVGGEVSFAEDTVEVVHEALIREWGTLREWINANRQFRTWQERLKAGLREWKNSDQDSGALLRGVPLSVAEDWLHKRAEEMTQEERDFIQISGQQQDKDKLLRQEEKLAAQNRMLAGLADELNNPAAAGRRGAGQLHLHYNFQKLQNLALQLNSLNKEQLKFLTNFQLQATQHTTKFDTLTQSDKEDEVTDWLEAHDVSNAWKLAPTLVSAGIDAEKLDTLADNIPEDCLSNVLIWLEAALAAGGLINDIEQSTSRISQLVKAIKGYSYMDQAPLQEIDLHDGIENTLLILNYLKKGVIVNREYDRTLPRICAYANELNQVWTNLIDNAIYAMNGKGELTICTYRENSCLVVEIADTGMGIPPAIQTRIFEPFFTTKGVEQGTGLGLEIAYRIIVKRHKGDIHFESKPGNTRFRVSLPIKLATD